MAEDLTYPPWTPPSIPWAPQSPSANQWPENSKALPMDNQAIINALKGNVQPQQLPFDWGPNSFASKLDPTQQGNIEDRRSESWASYQPSEPTNYWSGDPFAAFDPAQRAADRMIGATYRRPQSALASAAGINDIGNFNQWQNPQQTSLWQPQGPPSQWPTP